MESLIFLDLREFFRDMTFWNWIALIAFIFFPISALNAFLGLRARYRDWKGVRNQKQFLIRLAQLGKLVKRHNEFMQDPHKLYLTVIRQGLIVVIFFLVGVVCLAFVFFTQFIANNPAMFLNGPLSIIDVSCFYIATIEAIKIRSWVKYMHNPLNLNLRIHRFLIKAFRKKMIPREALPSEVFTNVEDSIENALPIDTEGIFKQLLEYNERNNPQT